LNDKNSKLAIWFIDTTHSNHLNVHSYATIYNDRMKNKKSLMVQYFVKYQRKHHMFNTSDA